MKHQMVKGIALSLFVSTLASPLYAQTAQTATPTAATPAAATAAPAEPAAEPAVGEELGYGFGSVVANVFYMPAKITYAGLGLLTGGIGWVLSGGKNEVANNIIYPAVKGNYVVTPSHLKGTDPLYFVGAPPPPPEPAPNYAAGAAEPKP